MGDGFTNYTLKENDFRFIAPPKAQKAEASSVAPTPLGRAHKSKTSKLVIRPPTLDDLTSASMLTYRSPWAFVAERFHCSEALLHSLNEQIGSAPIAGTVFKVPNVLPFEIEKIFDDPTQPLADPQNPVTAVIQDTANIRYYRNGLLVSVMPFYPPGQD